MEKRVDIHETIERDGQLSAEDWAMLGVEVRTEKTPPTRAAKAGTAVRRLAAAVRRGMPGCLQVAGGSAALAGFHMLVGTALALVVGGVVLCALGVLAEAARMRTRRGGK